MDVIARCAFGMKITDLGADEDDPFMKNAKAVFAPAVTKTPVVIIPCNVYRLIFE